MSLHRTLPSALMLSCVLWNVTPAGLEAAPPTRRSQVVQAVDKAKPAIVNIHSERTARGPIVDEFYTATPSQSRSNGMGTGIIIDPRGYIVTNHHVVEDVSLLRVRLNDGSNHAARVVARDREYDLAVLKIDVHHPLPTISIGTSSDLMVGESVIAIGNAYGYEHTVTVGVISALNRDVSLNKEISYKGLIQTDASINPGNSGGPLLNIDGDLVGVNVAIRAGAQGIGFAIPVDQMVQVVTDLLAKKRKVELAPGLVCKNYIDLKQSPPWILGVDRVDGFSPLAQAGLRNGDVVVRVGDLRTFSTLDLERALLDLQPGQRLPLLVRRNDGEHQLDVVVQASRAVGSPSDLAWRLLGVRMIPASTDQVAKSGSSLRGGMLITDVNPDSPAARAGITRGDILVGLHQWETVNLDNVAYVLQHPELSTFYPLKFFVIRGGQIHRAHIQAGD